MQGWDFALRRVRPAQRQGPGNNNHKEAEEGKILIFRLKQAHGWAPLPSLRLLPAMTP